MSGTGTHVDSKLSAPSPLILAFLRMDLAAFTQTLKDNPTAPGLTDGLTEESESPTPLDMMLGDIRYINYLIVLIKKLSQDPAKELGYRLLHRLLESLNSQAIENTPSLAPVTDVTDVTDVTRATYDSMIEILESFIRKILESANTERRSLEKEEDITKRPLSIAELSALMFFSDISRLLIRLHKTTSKARVVSGTSTETERVPVSDSFDDSRDPGSDLSMKRKIQMIQLVEENTELQQEINKLTSINDVQATIIQNERKKLEAQEKLTTEQVEKISKLEQTLSELAAQTLTLEEDINKLRAKVPALKKSELTSQQEKVVLQKQKVVLQKQKAAFEKQNTALHAEIAKSAEVIAEQTKKIATLERELAAARAREAKAETEAEQNKKSSAVKTRELTKIKSEVADLRKNLTESESQVTALRENIAQLGDQINALTKTLAERSGREGELQDDLSLIHSEKDALVKRIGQLEAKLKEKEKKEKKREAYTILTLRRQVNLLSRTNCEQQNTIDTLISEKKYLEAVLRELQLDIQKLNDALLRVTDEKLRLNSVLMKEQSSSCLLSTSTTPIAKSTTPLYFCFSHGRSPFSPSTESTSTLDESLTFSG